jgi:hypothetical protein
MRHEKSDVLSLALADESGRRSFPALEFQAEIADVQSMSSSDVAERRSFPAVEIQSISSSSNVAERRLSPAVEVQSMSSPSDVAERRSFPAVEVQSMSLSNIAERRSPAAPELRGSDTSRPYGIFETPRRDVRPFVFTEHNGMLMTEKSKIDMERYMRGREKWVMMVLKHNVMKTIRFDEVVEHMIEGARARKYFLVKRHYAAYFRERYRKI